MRPYPLLTIFFLVTMHLLSAQPITGVWRGKLDKRKVELKIVQKGDSLTGTSYYYESPTHYSRYSIKGYFDPRSNSVVWWDDQLLETKAGRSKTPMLSVADFNCPGGGEMYLDGNTGPKDDLFVNKTPVALTKVPATSFPDEWDYVIDNYTVGANDPELIDSIGRIATTAQPAPRPVAVVSAPLPPAKGVVRIPPPPVKPAPVAISVPQTIEEKFTARKKVVSTEIPLQGDSIELRFYDNAEVDGDSISLFLNNRLMLQHIRLTDKGYSVKLAITELDEQNELVMVAENLGSIPPNTSYMLALVAGQRYEATLASTENSSAVIRLSKTIAPITSRQK